MQNDSRLKLEGKCLISYTKEMECHTFFTDGVNTLKLLKKFSNLDIIDFGKIIIEKEMYGNGYEQVDSRLFTSSKNVQDFVNKIEEIESKLFLHHLNIRSENVEISIYDDRDFTIRFLKKSFDFKEKLIQLFISCFEFSDEKSELIYNKIIVNSGFFFLVNRQGDFLEKYNDFDDYLERN